jgi:hypothetical protein
MPEVKTINETRTSNVGIAKPDAKTFSPPTGYIWELLSLHLEIPPDPLANSGVHHMWIQSSPPGLEPQYLYYKSNHSTGININRRSVISADLSQSPSDEVSLGLTLDAMKFHPSEGIYFCYQNHTDHAHTVDRDWHLRVVEEQI